MIRIYEMKENVLSEEDKAWYERMNPGMKATGDVLTIGDEHSICSHVVFAGTQTPYGCVTDRGDHWIYNGPNGYDRIDKGTYQLSKDYGDN